MRVAPQGGFSRVNRSQLGLPAGQQPARVGGEWWRNGASQWGKRVLNARMVEVPDATQWETGAMIPILVSSIFLAAWLLGGTTVRRASAIIQALILLYSVVLAGSCRWFRVS